MATFAESGCLVSDLSRSSARTLLFATALAVVALSAVTYKYFEMQCAVLDPSCNPDH